MDDDNCVAFLVEYYYEGEKWGVTLWASSFEDAEKRLGRLQYGKVLGTLEGEVPANFGFLAKFRCWLHNVWAGKA